MSRPRVFVTRRLPGDAIERLAVDADVDLWPLDTPPGNLSLRERAQDADGIVCLLTDRIDARLIDGAARLKVISNVAVGYDNIDVAAATKRGVPVGNTPGVLTETTADLAWALMLAVARRIVEAERFVREARWRTWDPGLLLGRDVHGATLGIVGYGKIGRAMARRSRGFGMRVVFTSRTPGDDGAGAQPVTLDDLLQASDFVSLHVPLTPETHHMIGESQLRAMKPSAVLINTARGAIIDQRALVLALEQGWIGGAGLDVAEVEPVPPGDALMRAPNVVLLPHIGSASHATRERMANMAVDNCLAGLRSERLPNCVNPEVYG
jgi:glyoxylate reductase